MNTEKIARIVHAAKREYCRVLGDSSCPPAAEWQFCGDEMRQSAIQGIEAFLKDPDGTTPEKSHESWSKFKKDHGWQYGPVKDELMKTHPCLVLYEDLPEAQQRKDCMFLAIIICMTHPLDEI